MSYTVITEGPSDILILRSILGITPDDANVRFVEGGGWSAADSLARSYLIHGDTNIALVVDAEANDMGHIAERKRFLERSLGEIRSRKDWRVFVFAPEIEMLLFQERSILESLVGHPLSERDLVRSEFAPKEVIASLIQSKNLLPFLKSRLPAVDLAPLRNIPLMRELVGYLGLQEGSYSVNQGRTLIHH